MLLHRHQHLLQDVVSGQACIMANPRLKLAELGADEATVAAATMVAVVANVGRSRWARNPTCMGGRTNR